MDEIRKKEIIGMITAIEESMMLGITEVSYNNKKTVYKSTNDMIVAINYMKRKLMNDHTTSLGSNQYGFERE